MIKYEKGRNRPTENRAANSILNQEIDKWVKKIDAASAEGDVQYGIKRVGEVLVELANDIREGKVDKEVFHGILSRRNVYASLLMAQKEFEGVA